MQQKFLIMGVINITPDSFSDGGRFYDVEAALRQADQLRADGADILDIGAESTRPGSLPISVEEERERLEPLLKRLAARSHKTVLSLDTYKPELMRLGIDHGVEVINNIRGLVDAKTLRFLADQQVTYLAMHCHGEPQTMQEHPLSAEEAVQDVSTFFAKTSETLGEAGFPSERIWLDPGIGFGKTDQANLKLLTRAAYFSRQYNLAVGISRKGFIGRMTGIQRPEDRDPSTKMLEWMLAEAGVKVIRTHDVAGLARIRHMIINK